LPLADFQKCCPLSKENCSLAAYLLDLKTGEIAPGRYSKVLGATARLLSSISSKRFELAGFEKLAANSKAFGAK
jgi:hypothetical protein